MHPTAHRATDPTLNAQVLFGHTHHPDARIEVRPLVVDGIEYLTNRLLVIRRDRLHSLDSDWMRLGPEVTHGLQYLADALKDTPVRTLPAHRFDPHTVCALQLCGAGIAVLSSQHTSNLHAVVHAGVPIGLAVPTPDTHSAAPLGVIPGVQPWPGEADSPIRHTH